MAVMFLGMAGLEVWGITQGARPLRLFLAALEVVQFVMAVTFFRLYRWKDPAEAVSTVLPALPFVLLGVALAAGMALAALA